MIVDDERFRAPAGQYRLCDAPPPLSLRTRRALARHSSIIAPAAHDPAHYALKSAPYPCDCLSHTTSDVRDASQEAYRRLEAQGQGRVRVLLVLCWRVRRGRGQAYESEEGSRAAQTQGARQTPRRVPAYESHTARVDGVQQASRRRDEVVGVEYHERQFELEEGASGLTLGDEAARTTADARGRSGHAQVH